MYLIHCLEHETIILTYYGICSPLLTTVWEESEKSPALLWAASTLTTVWWPSCRQPPPFMVYYRWYWMLQQICHNTGPLGVNQKTNCIAMLWSKWKMPVVTIQNDSLIFNFLTFHEIFLSIYWALEQSFITWYLNLWRVFLRHNPKVLSG